MRLSPSLIESTLTSQSESLPASWMALKSMNSRYSGSELAMISPLQLSMLPRMAFTATLSFFTRLATSIQYARLALMM